MKIYNIADVLPLYKKQSRIFILPNEDLLEFEKQLEVDEVESYIDNDDIDFVTRNIEQGQIAEAFIKDLLLKLYSNCEKVKAKEGYDFKVIINNREIRIEVKAIQTYNAPFHITINEIDHATEYGSDYYLCFVVLPSIEKGVKDIKFLQNPINSLGITVPCRKYDGLKRTCTIIPEKFLIKCAKDFIKQLSSSLDEYLKDLLQLSEKEMENI